ncbi:MAG: ABC transporter permease [Acidimicrobiales bacterium]
MRGRTTYGWTCSARATEERTHDQLRASLPSRCACSSVSPLIWMFVTIGLVAGSAQAAQGIWLLVFPLTFVSSAYVPVDSMPGWLQAFAYHQPITIMADAVRALVRVRGARRAVGHPSAHLRRSRGAAVRAGPPTRGRARDSSASGSSRPVTWSTRRPGAASPDRSRRPSCR